LSGLARSGAAVSVLLIQGDDTDGSSRYLDAARVPWRHVRSESDLEMAA
jgi:hypothetical protein